jgi:hypothetical protein
MSPPFGYKEADWETGENTFIYLNGGQQESEDALGLPSG